MSFPFSFSSKNRAISLFSGLGGAEYGFKLAGIETAVSLELDSLACASLRANYDHTVIQGDISAMVDADPDCRGILESAGLQPGEAFVLMGGPPCQSFSRAGKRLGALDPRGLLYIPFLSVVRAALPRFVVMENAPDLANMRLDPADSNSPTVLEDIKNRLQEIGYQSVIHAVLDAVSYGAPQFRSRLIIVASRDGEDIFLPHPTHYQHHQDPDRRWRTLRDGIGGLTDPGAYLPISDKLWGNVKDAQPGGYVRSLSPEVRQPHHNKGINFRKLGWDEPCPTLLCQPGHWTTLLTHPEERRFLSVREYARIQGLPDDYVIAGDAPSPQYRQLGNAWPAALGHAIGQMLVSVATDAATIRTRRKSAAKLPTAFATIVAQPVKAPKGAKKKVKKAANTDCGDIIDIEELIAARAKETIPQKAKTERKSAHKQKAKSVLGSAIQAAREAAGLSRPALASKVELTKGAVQHIEGGVGCLDTLLALADQLGLVLVGTNLTGDGDLGERLLALRMKRGYISQREFADVSKITAPTLSRIESGNTSVQLAKVVGYATFLGVTLSLQPKDKPVVSHADHRTTPQDFALALAEVVGGQWDVDPASPGPELCHIPALRHITAAQDGLAQPWGRGSDGMGLAADVWVNPPYGRSKGGSSMRDWLTKAVAEVDSGRARMVVSLIMAAPGTAYWRELVVERGAHVRFVTGRLKFDGLKSGADFDSAIVVWGGNADDHQRVDEAVADWEQSRSSARRPAKKAASSQSKVAA